MITIIGPHKVNCGSLVSGEVDQMLAGETVAVFYSDPPWGDGNLAYWKTMAKKMTGQDLAQVNHEQLYDRLTELIQSYVGAGGHVFIETGLRWREFVVRRLQAIGLTSLMTQRIQYGSGAKLYDNVLVSASKGAAKPFDLDASPYRGAELVRRVVGSVATPGGGRAGPVLRDGLHGEGGGGGRHAVCGQRTESGAPGQDDCFLEEA